VPILFGTYNSSTATAAEVELSQSFQTAFANFAKNPKDMPAHNWPAYEPGVIGIAHNRTLARIAYHKNVDPENFVKRVQPISTVSTQNDYAYFTLFIAERYYDRMGRAFIGIVFWIIVPPPVQ
jgi:hypothetical protein